MTLTTTTTTTNNNNNNITTTNFPVTTTIIATTYNNNNNINTIGAAIRSIMLHIIALPISLSDKTPAITPPARQQVTELHLTCRR